MAKAIYEMKKIDIEIQKGEQELRKELAEKTENKANHYHKLVMVESQEQKIELQIKAKNRQEVAKL